MALEAKPQLRRFARKRQDPLIPERTYGSSCADHEETPSLRLQDPIGKKENNRCKVRTL
ncbi:3745_t:CDS:2 [Gigaspora margarita]|uniref:3745_t:CDS:1 n=1 Tax=Gigaspora margarita TaxID=4874 RepID=A0ABN7V3L7_GIGMA|nr:3745_t:CDS:2 [Gigaspora margarita]